MISVYLFSLTLSLCALFLGCKSSGLQEISVSAAEISAAEPTVALDLQGNVFVLYVEHNLDKSADVFLQKFDSQLKPTSEKTRINPQAGQATAWRGDPPTIKISGETIYVGWTARVAATEGSANDLFLSVSHDGGKSFDAPVKVNDDASPAVHGMHALEVDKNNRVYFAWLDERFLKNVQQPPPMDMSENVSGEMKHKHGEPNREVYFAVSGDGGKTLAPNKKLAENVCPCCKVSMTVSDNNKLYVSWRQVLEGDFRHIAAAHSADHGESFSAPTIVSNDQWQISACPVSGAPLSVGKNQLLQTVWYTAGSAGVSGLYEADSDNDAKTFSPRKLIFEGAISGTPILLADQIVWESGGKIFKFAEDSTAKPKFVCDGMLPSAASANGKTYVAFIKKEGEKTSVKLTSF